jgi:hypothetical protein
MKYLALFLFLILFSCKSDHEKQISVLNQNIENQQIIQENENTIKTRFSIPKGFVRKKTNPNSFENYLQNFKLKQHNTKVHLHDNSLKSRQDVHAAILNITVGKKDLQQCADATIRLRAEFLYQQKRYNDIHFKFTNGFNVAYSKWRQGYRLNISGNKVTWYKTDKESTSYASFSKYLQYIFMYAGTLSLNKELKKVAIKDIKIGDIFIQGGSPGHAVIVVDIAKNNENETIFMLAQSYMPAQEIHILKNFNDTKNSPWYSTKKLEVLTTPEWRFTKENLKRF